METKSKLLLDGDKMPEKEFAKRFKEIVHTNKKWFQWKGTHQEADEEFCTNENDKYLLVCSSYNAPKLYEKYRKLKQAIRTESKNQMQFDFMGD